MNEKTNKSQRTVHPISRPDDFFDHLQYLLHLATGDILFHDVQFTVLLNAINRAGKETRYFDRDKLEGVPLVYTGLNAQRDLLKKSFPGLIESENAWKELEETKKESDRTMQWLKVSQDYFAQAAKGNLDLEDIKVGKLKEYFAGDLNPIQKAEKVIFEQKYVDPISGKKKLCFNPKKDCYLSIPLIGFAEFDGVAHIIFEGKGKKIVTPYLIGLVIKRFSNEYEGWNLDWASIGENIEKRKTIARLFDDEIYDDSYWVSEGNIVNPILSKLGYRERYKKYKPYYDFRLKEADTIPDVLYLQYLRQAITAILIDSYAHNISAHSLTALTWWFRLRSQLWDKLKQEEAEKMEKLWIEVAEDLGHGTRMNSTALEKLTKNLWEIRDYRKNKETEMAAQKGKDSDGIGLIRYAGHLSRELHPFFKFLMEKGAYWSGITRDTNVGGKINSFFSILWYDFINNPLYLGTIAKTEDIRKISIGITMYKPNEVALSESLEVTREIDFEGMLTEVDLDNPRDEPFTDDEELSLQQRSVFVEPGDTYNELKDRLDNIKIYLPGGVVGKHSLFTMIENEIRNVKHYHGEELATLQKEGLTIQISLQPCSLPGSQRQELYRIGIWLKTPTRLSKPGDRHLVQRKWDFLYNEITEPGNHSPKLGGTHQDKICAAMLMNNRFSSVQDGFKSPNRDDRKDTDRDRTYFPWVFPACSRTEEAEPDAAHFHTDFVLNARNVKNVEKQGNTFIFPETYCGKGYLKKYIHLWRFEDALNLADGGVSEFENNGRFRFVSIPGTMDHDSKLLELRKDAGVVRVISGASPEAAVKDIYENWLRIWASGKMPPVLLLTEEGKRKNLFALDKGHFKFFTADDFQRNNPDAERLARLAEANAAECVLAIEHKADVVGKPDVLRYRNHGSLRTWFWANAPDDAAINPFLYALERHPDRMHELFETLWTRVAVFDNRLWQRIRKDIEDSRGTDGTDDKRLDFYRHKLKLVVHGESPMSGEGDKSWLNEWERERDHFVPGCHFLVLHLSFIERIMEANYLGHPEYAPGNIGLFIKEELLPKVAPGGNIPDNFILVITTGRGKNDWLESLKNNKEYQAYQRFTIFRPVESLISAVEHSLGMKDDVDLKFRLVKVLFGS